MSDRAFGFTLAVVSSVAAFSPAISGKPIRVPFLAAGALLVLAASFLPTLLRGPKVVWMAVTSRIAALVNWALMASIFFLVVTPVGVLFRLIGRDPLRRRFEKDLPSYWIPKDASIPQSMRQQF